MWEARAPRSAVNVVENPWDLVMSWPVNPNAWAWRCRRSSPSSVGSPRSQAVKREPSGVVVDRRVLDLAAVLEPPREGHGPIRRSWSRTWRGRQHAPAIIVAGREVGDRRAGRPTTRSPRRARGTASDPTRRRSWSGQQLGREPLGWTASRRLRARRRGARRGSGRGPRRWNSATFR